MLWIFKKVYSVVKQIPFGRVTTYGSIAKYIGHPKSSRTVGWALNVSHYTKIIPAHRVVNRSGILTGKHHFQRNQFNATIIRERGY